VLGVLAPVLLVLGIWLGGHPDNLPGFLRDPLVGDSDARNVDDAIDRIHATYYRDVGRGELVDRAIGGMVASLHDRFSHYFSAKEYEAVRESTQGQFSGVGMTVQRDPRGLRVKDVYDKSPAQRAGIRAGDVIVAVNGRSLKGRSSDDATTQIKGRPGTDVRLTWLRGSRRITRTVTRATLALPVVASHLRRTPDRTPYADVSLAQFSSGAHGELRGAIDKLLGRGAKGIVLDLRANPGGLVEEARLVSSIFIPEGPIVSTRGRAQPTRTLNAAGGAISTKIPVVVLVDRDTASAAEIVTGALKDRHRARVVGTHTFGKGVFQEVTTLPNGGALDITVGQYFTPSGRNLGGGGVRRGAGIAPDVTARDNLHTKRDEALDAAARVLQQRLDG
jgi:carboxyl-terminal processing protease